VERERQWKELRADGYVDLSPAGLLACEIHAQTFLLGWDAVSDLRGIADWSAEDRDRLLRKLESLRDVHQAAIVRRLKS